MHEDLNLKVRSQVLEYSLSAESDINTLLLSYLAITDDKNQTKNFGNKAGISFKNKLDLLYDINVFNKEEYLSIDLLMIFRNRFMHDIDSNSFTYILENLENGLKNRFLVFIEEDEKELNEKTYEKAFKNLYFHNLKIIHKKYKERRQSLEKHKNSLIGVVEIYESLSLLSCDFASKISSETANILENNPEALIYLQNLSESILNHIDELDKLSNVHTNFLENNLNHLILFPKKKI